MTTLEIIKFHNDLIPTQWIYPSAKSKFEDFIKTYGEEALIGVIKKLSKLPKDSWKTGIFGAMKNYGDFKRFGMVPKIVYEENYYFDDITLSILTPEARQTFDTFENQELIRRFFAGKGPHKLNWLLQEIKKDIKAGWTLESAMEYLDTFEKVCNSNSEAVRNAFSSKYRREHNGWSRSEKGAVYINPCKYEIDEEDTYKPITDKEFGRALRDGKVLIEK